MTFCTVSIRGV